MFLLIRDQHLGDLLDEFGDDQLDEVFRAGYRYQRKTLAPAWKSRAELDAVVLRTTLIALHQVAAEKSQEKEQKLSELKELDRTWVFSRDEVKGTTNWFKGARRKWLVTRCVAHQTDVTHRDDR